MEHLQDKERAGTFECVIAKCIEANNHDVGVVGLRISATVCDFCLSRFPSLGEQGTYVRNGISGIYIDAVFDLVPHEELNI